MLQRIRSSLQAKIIIAVVGLLAVTLGTSFLMERWESERAFQEKLHIEIENISAVLTSAIHNVMLKDDRSRMDGMISEISKVGAVKRLYVLKPGGKVYAASDKTISGRFGEGILQKAARSGKAAFELKKTPGGEPFIVGMIPILAKSSCLECHSQVKENEPIGFLGLERWAVGDVRRLHAGFRKHALTSLATISISCLVLAWSLRRLVTRPIKMLRQSSKRIGDGEFDYRIRLETGDEIETLANEFNRMAAKLADSHAALEQKVAEQTENLAEEMLGRERAERALLQTEEKFRSLVESTSEWVWELDPNGVFIYTSPKVKNLLGYGPEEVIGKTPFDFMLPGEARRVAMDGLQIISHQKSMSVPENRHIPNKGLEALLVSIAAASGREEDQNAPDRRDNAKNPNGNDLSRRPFRKIQSRIDFARGTSETFGGRRFSVRSAAEKGFVKDYEIVFRTKDGGEMIALTTVSDVHDDRGNTLGYRGIIRDVTEQKKLEQQFLHAQKMESIGTLAGGIAHDFNNILSGIMGYASLLKTKIPEDDPIFGQIDIIEKSAKRAAELTSQLLGFARGGKYEIKPVNLNSIADETLKMVSRTFDKSIEIKTRFHEPLPTIEGDAGQLEQVLMNLCVNARDAMDGGGKLTIETDIEAPSEEYLRTHWEAKPGLYVTLSVCDTGVGIDKDVMKKIFEPFFTTKEKEKGTGLGLSMVYGVVKNHGGFISVYSELCMGTTFKIYLPVSGKPEKEEAPEAERPIGGNELILVVDDEEPLRALAREMLEAYGYRVLLAQNGVDAVKIYEEHKDEIDLAILDMVMPKMGGRETFLRLKELNPEVKALLSSGYSQGGKARAILNSGVMGFIQKPYQVSELLSKVRNVLDAEILA